ncbi:MAG: IS110 family transposase [Rhodospirillaceae bacterium]|nr:IS110 family transposase [Rhodospirillaceae bacterium]
MRAHLRPLCDALSAELTPQARFMLHDQLQAFHDTTSRIAQYDGEIERGLARHRAQIDLLGTIPVIDRHSARAILVELGPDIGVFASARHCAAWAGVCPGNNESAGKRRSGRTRRGNTTLREVLIECAQTAARTHHCQFRVNRR